MKEERRKGRNKERKELTKKEYMLQYERKTDVFSKRV
jgi:hypothetical protein